MKKTCYTLLITILLSISAKMLYAQNTSGDLIKQGIALHNQGKYDDAIAKYNEALKLDPNNEYGHYELAFSLYAENKYDDAIPHLEISVKSANKNLSVASYSLLGTIYDNNKQGKKAIEIYKKAIEIDPDYPQIYYNLGITYSRNQMYPEAEASAIEAIKHDQKNASSQRLYALVCFHENKRANALLGLCSFLLLEPTGQRAAEAYGNIQHILQGGVLKDANGNNAIAVSIDDAKENNTLNTAISMVTLAARTQKLTGADLLEYQLKSIFAITGELSAKKTEKTFFDKFFVDYFYKLSQSDNMPVFAHTVALQGPNRDESGAWLKAHTDQIHALGEWIKNTPRSF